MNLKLLELPIIRDTFSQIHPSSNYRRSAVFNISTIWFRFVELRLLITPLISLNLFYNYARHPDKELILFAPTTEPNS
jgi:hypothetical protein